MGEKWPKRDSSVWRCTHKPRTIIHELNCIILLDYTLRKSAWNNTRITGPEGCNTASSSLFLCRTVVKKISRLVPMKGTHHISVSCEKYSCKIAAQKESSYDVLCHSVDWQGNWSVGGKGETWSFGTDNQQLSFTFQQTISSWLWHKHINFSSKVDANTPCTIIYNSVRTTFLPSINEKHGLLPAKNAAPVAMLRCQLSYDWTISLLANADATGGRGISGAPRGQAVNFYSISPLSVAAHFTNGAVSHRQLVAPSPVYTDLVSTAVIFIQNCEKDGWQREGNNHYRSRQAAMFVDIRAFPFAHERKK
jgi:hypothetical protein